MANRDRMPAPMSLEDYAAQVGRDWAEEPRDFSRLAEAPRIVPIMVDPVRPTPRPRLNSDITESVTVQAVRPASRRVSSAPSDAGSGGARTWEGLERAAKYTGRMIEGQHAGTTGLLQIARSEKPYRALRTIKRIAPIFRGANAGFTLAGEAAGVVSDLKRGVPLQVVAPGAVLHGGGSAAAAALGGLLLSPFGPVGVVGGAMLGSMAADHFLPSRERLGKTFLKAADAYGKNPFYGMP